MQCKTAIETTSIVLEKTFKKVSTIPIKILFKNAVGVDETANDNIRVKCGRIFII